MESIANAVIELADKHFGEYKIKNGELIPLVCPLCKGGSHRDKETFAIGLWSGLWNCKRGGCDGIDGTREGNFKQLCNHFGEAAFEFSALPKAIRETKKVYDKPDPEILQPLTEEIKTYFAGRGISTDTLDDFKIAADKRGNIVFPFYRNGELVFIKRRVPKMFATLEKEYKEKIAKLSPEEAEKVWKPVKEWREPNTEPILFGMDNTTFNKPLVITEGQIDALSIYEAGYHNVVSVPSGCEDMEWITLCYDWLEKFNQIILFGDNDEPGMEMVTTLMKRLGEDRCMIPKEYPELIFNGQDYNRQCKDANEILRAYGAEGLKAIIDACEPAPIKGILDLSTIRYVDPTTVPRIMTRINALDNMIGGFGEGGVTVISGSRGEGKSTISSGFLLQAIEQGHSVCAYSGELSQNKFLEWIMLAATESRFVSYKQDTRSGKRICIVPFEVQERIRDWMAGKFFLFDNGYSFEEDEQSSVMKVFEMCARRYGCSLFLIDNLMSLLTTSDEENKAQAKFMAKVKAFATKYKVHVLVVCHPRKRQPGKEFSNDDVSGSSVLTNLADNVFSIEKPNIRVTKCRDFGETGLILCDYDPVNRRIYQKNLGDRVVYGWDHSNLLEPEDKAVDLPEYQVQPGGQDEVPF